MQAITTYRDRALSLWQSAVEEAAAGGKKSVASIRGKPLALAATAVAAAFDEGKSLARAPAPDKLTSLAMFPASILSKIGDAARQGWKCAQLAFQLTMATAEGDWRTAQQLQQELNFSTCDPGWAKTVATFIAYYQLGKGSIPYRHGGDYVLDDLPESATVGLIGDWGTGTDTANGLLRALARAKPDVVFHLGDIYYSGTPFECQRFYDNATGILKGTRLYTLSGNHDMYSGGIGYYRLVDQLGQQASYFCVGNSRWQFLAMDTGRDDFDPRDVNTDVPGLTPEEADWHVSKIKQAGGRKTILLSHHPLFSAFEAIGGNALNDKLLGTFKSVLDQVAAWFWGHEHRLDIYDPYLGLQRGRCLGCSAIPVFVGTTFFTPKFKEVPLLTDPDSGKPVQLDNNGKVYNYAYAILKLSGASADVTYYQFDGKKSSALFSETIT
jgi:hypothetical protein